jgi:hypothetical protein
VSDAQFFYTACDVSGNGFALVATRGARATLFDLGDFTGQLHAEDGGTVSLIGARQTSGATNDADFFGRIVAEANLDVKPPTQSSLRNTNAAHFARVLVTDGTVIQGAIQCTTAADAVLDKTVTVTQGATITGCQHAPTPLP